MNFFFRSRNFVKFIKNKQNFNYISNLNNRLKSRCLDKIEKRSFISLSESSTLSSNAKSFNFLSISENNSSIISSNKIFEEKDLNFILNDDIVFEKWYFYNKLVI